VCNQHPQLLEACSTAVEDIASDPLFPKDNSESGEPLISRYSSRTAVSLGSSTPSTRTSISSGKDSASTSTSIDSSLPSPGWTDRPSESNALIGGYSNPSLIIRRACRHDCYCICHEEPTTKRSSGGFSRFNAQIFSQDNKPKVECSDPSCAAAISQKKPIPVSFFKKAMSHMMSTSSIKIRYHLNTYRMVPEGSSAMRYVKQGNLEKLKLAIQSGEATPWDTAPDGWSLLHVCFLPRYYYHLLLLHLFLLFLCTYS
jgi:hypothetical protein